MHLDIEVSENIAREFRIFLEDSSEIVLNITYSSFSGDIEESQYVSGAWILLKKKERLEIMAQIQQFIILNLI